MGALYNDLPHFDQCEMIAEFQEKYYRNYCIEDIDEALMFVNPVVNIKNGQYELPGIEVDRMVCKKLKELNQRNTHI